MLEGFGGTTIVGERYGDGPVEVVALHGWGRSHRDFDPVFGHRTGFGVLALDLPGFGGSPPPAQVWGSPTYAEEVAGILATFGRPLVVVGHSFGGRVALHLAHRFPALVGGLCLTGVPQLAPTTSTGRPSGRFRMIRAAHRLGLVGDATLERARLRYGSRDYREAEGVLRAVLVELLGERYGPLLADIDVPVELVWGSADTAAPLAGAEYAAALLPHAHLEVLEGIGHDVPRDAPDRLRAAVERLVT